MYNWLNIAVKIRLYIVSRSQCLKWAGVLPNSNLLTYYPLVLVGLRLATSEVLLYL